MSVTTDYDYWGMMWEKYAPRYLKWCRDNGVQADLSGFSIWCDETNLTGDDEIYANE